MKTRFIISAAVVAAMSLASVSCTDDSSVYGGNDLPTLSVKVPGDAEMPIYSFDYGTDCVLTPEIIYNGTGELSYEWSVGDYSNGIKGQLSVVSHDKTLNYFFPQGGAYYAHLVVTDGSVGIVQDYEISINRTFEQGYLVVSNTSDGKGNLAFIKDLTREEIEAGLPVTIMENCLQRVNENVGTAPLVGSMMISWPDYITGGNTYIYRLVIMDEDAAYYIDPNTFVISSVISYDEIIPGFKGGEFVMDYTSPILFNREGNKNITFNSENMFGYEASSWQGKQFDVIRGYYYKTGYNWVSDNYFASLSPLTVYNKGNYDWSSSQELKDSDGNILFTNEEYVTMFKSEGIANELGMNDYYCVVFSRNNGNGKIYSTSMSGLGMYSMGIELVGRGEIVTDTTTALPDNDSQIVASDLYHRTFFSNDNKVYVMLMDGSTYRMPSVSQAAITFPANEEITYMTINTDPDNNTRTDGEDMVIATVDKNTGRGNVYIYDVRDLRTDNPDPAPKTKYMNCADRISYITYKVRVAN
ncbi:MAG: hypothetical protein NC411_02305 [Bacteroides sp.]|nr:hypothetical protein [Bacteroides sp.]